jgi:hypothetical protein
MVYRRNAPEPLVAIIRRTSADTSAVSAYPNLYLVLGKLAPCGGGVREQGEVDLSWQPSSFVLGMVGDLG